MHGNFEMFADMARFVGKTVTVFTTSGGISGGGFTGVLACVDNRVVRLITRIGAPPACPLGSTCTGWGNNWGGGCGWGNNWGGGCNNWGWGGWDAGSFMGSVTEIPGRDTKCTQLKVIYQHL
ncbi:MAG: hypothetical protein FWC93_07805 [Defluviitaleaceae bacterium]|nr:hypothetical protein [Defluviitaleaceae bacterium]